MTILFWLIFLFGLLLTAWYLWIRGRGSLRFWIRVVDQEEAWVLGAELPLDAPQSARQSLLTDVNAAVRSVDQHVNTVVRQWNHEKGTLWMGVRLRHSLEGEVPSGFEQKHWPAKKVLRLSGDNRLDERNHMELLKEYLGKEEVAIDRERPVQLSGQSFSLYQWDLKEGSKAPEPSALMNLEEKTFQLRDNLVLPTIGSVTTLGLLGTGQPLLFAVGVLLVVFLSGACKFVFIHQRKDEADEIHLQNY